MASGVRSVQKNVRKTAMLLVAIDSTVLAKNAKLDGM